MLFDQERSDSDDASAFGLDRSNRERIGLVVDGCVRSVKGIKIGACGRAFHAPGGGRISASPGGIVAKADLRGDAVAFGSA
ncbi:hypothetical protein MesoLjLb_13630 [Mesorhizobium sp. L-8-3]|nr:hypothetical protein MesoLjLb_13630 [Mesorhizobium sp. L-8-3]